MQDLNEQFNAGLKKLVVPIRFSILALLTARKCTVFDESIVKLINYIRELKFEDVAIYQVA